MFTDFRVKCDPSRFLYEQTDIMPKNNVAAGLSCVIKEATSVFLNENGESMFCFDAEGERRVILGKYRNFHFRSSRQLGRCSSAFAWPIFNG